MQRKKVPSFYNARKGKDAEKTANQQSNQPADWGKQWVGSGRGAREEASSKWPSAWPSESAHQVFLPKPHLCFQFSHWCSIDVYRDSHHELFLHWEIKKKAHNHHRSARICVVCILFLFFSFSYAHAVFDVVWLPVVLSTQQRPHFPPRAALL